MQTFVVHSAMGSFTVESTSKEAVKEIYGNCTVETLAEFEAWAIPK